MLCLILAAFDEDEGRKCGGQNRYGHPFQCAGCHSELSPPPFRILYSLCAIDAHGGRIYSVQAILGL